MGRLINVLTVVHNGRGDIFAGVAESPSCLDVQIQFGHSSRLACIVLNLVKESKMWNWRICCIFAGLLEAWLNWALWIELNCLLSVEWFTNTVEWEATQKWFRNLCQCVWVWLQYFHFSCLFIFSRFCKIHTVKPCV